ncbi:hypothetical protein [Kitasatospora sp. NPDC085879]|uniref:hypothetical protein n=1 Tax=Kitasatospora sp. NPDC085879 TaxID=3154769 RepID=UPI000BB0DC43|nr:hypothetical protein [Streptomyces sp. TLI_235]PBC69833.1 hypothetical protein BX265_7191 [Streptomyces sp. TLI_235]
MPAADPSTAAPASHLEPADNPALTLTVYRTGPDGGRHDIATHTVDRGTGSYAPPYPVWPDCTCPQHGGQA